MRNKVIVLLLFLASAAALGQRDSASPPQASQPSFAAAAKAPLDAIRGWLGGSSSPAELLPPEEAFQIAVRVHDQRTLIAELKPARDYYIYRDRIGFTLRDAPGITIADVRLPKGEPKADPTFGAVDVFHRPFKAVIALAREAGASERLTLLASYQGCNEPLGVCYPPVERAVTLTLAGTVASDTSVRPSPPSPASGAASSEPLADDSPGRIQQLFTAGNRWALVAAFFGFGLLLAFTPCMLPMIPILSGIIVGREQPMTRRHALGLSAVYVLAMAITYAVAGVAAGLAGTLLSAYLQNPWVLGGFAAIFVALALSMFGLYELQMPAALQSRLAGAGSRIRGGRVAGVFAMGVLSAIIVGPCVAAPLAGALLYIGQSRDAVLGGAALFSMALGMGVPLLAVGATAGTLLPRAGAWTRSVKRVFGVLMLGVAVYMVSPVIPVVAQQLLWAALLVIPAVYLHALDPLPSGAPGHARLFKGVGVLALVAGVALMVGALAGHRDILQPLAGFTAAGGTERRELAFQPVSSVAEFESRLKAAEGRPVMLEFSADWCVSCKEMEQFTFADPRVQERLRQAVLLRADVTAHNAEHRALLARFSLFGPPGIVFFDPHGSEVGNRVIGYQSAQRFLASLSRAWPA